MKKVVAFGAGNYYKEKRAEIAEEYEITAFCDNDPQKVGGGYYGKPVIAVEDIGADADILITSIYRYEMIEQLIRQGISADRIEIVKPQWMRICSEVKVTEKGIEAVCRGIRVELHDAIEEMIYREINYNDDYNLYFPEDSVVIDVGLNVGLATLFFAGKEYVSKVYAFEPDPFVYQRALHNIDLNPSVKGKIEARNVACSDRNRKAVYSLSPIPSAGISRHYDQTTDTIEVDCVDSAQVLGAVIDRHYGKNAIIMKSDCEGAEYEIFDRLEQTGYFGKIDAFVMEWHDDRRSEIEDIFKRNGYAYIINTVPGRIFGKCYAVKRK